MPYYHLLRHKIRDDTERRRAVESLIQLRSQLDASVPRKEAEDNLLLATWNIRDFGKPLSQRRGWGPRLPETWFYIAEIISRFDFVAVQEVNQLGEWDDVMDILGRHWKFLATDVTDPALGGNGERMTFAYDSRKVTFQGIAGEIVLPPEYLISRAELVQDDRRIVAGNQFKRTPFMASFQSGWLKFDICTVHLYYGDDSGPKLAERVEEIRTIARYLGTRAERALGQDRALFVLGDFNIVSPEHQTMKALTENGFVVPQALQRNPTTDTRKHYDQIAFKTRPELIEYVESQNPDPLRRNAGTVPLYERIFTDAQFDGYAGFVKEKSSAGRNARTPEALRDVYRDWRTYQMSDHYPMWVRLQTDGSGPYLARMAARQGPDSPDTPVPPPPPAPPGPTPPSPP